MDCIKIGMCPFYNDKMPMTSGLGAIYKKKYCLGNNELCARWKVFRTLGQAHVPDTLYPSMIDIAHQIIESEDKMSADNGNPVS
jgi:hypothetical protein